MEDGEAALSAVEVCIVMTKKDAVQFLMGYIMGAASKGERDRRINDRTFAQKAFKRGYRTLSSLERGFFNALERVVDEELTEIGYHGELN